MWTYFSTRRTPCATVIKIPVLRVGKTEHTHANQPTPPPSTATMHCGPALKQALKEPMGLGVLNTVTNHPFLSLPQTKTPSMVVPSPGSQTWRESHSSPWRTVSGTLLGTAHREAQGQALPSEPHKSSFTQLSLLHTTVSTPTSFYRHIIYLFLLF